MKRFLTALLLSSSTLMATAADDSTRVYLGTRGGGVFTTELNNTTGALTPATLAGKVKDAGFICMHPSQQYLYSTAQLEDGQGAVFAWKIGDDGTLNKISEQGVGGKSLCHISLDASDRVLMGANYSEGKIVSLPVGKDGSLGKLASLHQHEGSSQHPDRQQQAHAHSIYHGPNNRFAYAVDLGMDKIITYAIDPESAKLTKVGATEARPGAGPRHMKFGKDGKQAYVLNELSVDISVYDRDPSSGQLSRKQVISTMPDGADKTKVTCSEIRVSKDGQFVYAANRDLTKQGRDSIAVFSVGEEGKLTRIQNIHAEVWIPRNINLDPSGQWLLVAGQRSNNVTVFRIDRTTGKLSFSGHHIEVPSAMCIEFRQ